MRYRTGTAYRGLVMVFFALAGPVRAQHITVDGSLSAARTLTGPNYAIGANLGKQVGGNLFQSFGAFSLSTGESATFNGPQSVTNVVGRVTGGSASSINGAINSTIPGANVYLINPAGVMFGPNAQVNVSGSFHASTADYLKMSDGGRFQATNPNASTVTAAPPQAFGFLTPNPQPVVVNGSTLGPVSGTIGLVGGPVTVTGGKLLAPAGTVHIASVAGVGEVPIDPRAGPTPTVTSFGPVTIAGGSTINVSDPTNLGSGGSVLIRAGSLSFSGSEINADNYGPGNGGTIVLHADDQLALTSSASVHGLAMGTGAGAALKLVTTASGSVTIDASNVSAGSMAAGGSGGITINTGSLSLRNGAFVSAIPYGQGAGGAISVNAATVMLDGVSYIDAGTQGPANSGSIAITAQNVTLLDSSYIAADTIGQGAGGSVQINATGTVLLDGTGLDQNQYCVCTYISADSVNTVLSPNPGAAGSVMVAAQNIMLRGNATISTDSYGNNRGGDVTIMASGNVVVDGSLATNTGLGTDITAEALGNGDGGSVSVSARNITLMGGGYVATDTSGPGAAGTVRVTATGTLLLDGTGGPNNNGDTTYISSDSDPSQSGMTTGFGPAGSVMVTAQNIILRGDATITSDTYADGRGGDVTVTAFGDITVDGSLATSAGFGTEITAETIPGSTGNGGAVSVTARNITLVGGGYIATDTYGSGSAGTVRISATGMLLLDGISGPNQAGDTPFISSDSVSSANMTSGLGPAGVVTVTAQNIVLRGAAVISSSAYADGRGGDVSVTAFDSITIDGSSAPSGFGTSISAAASGTGNAGDVSVSAANGITIIGNASTFTTGISAQASPGSGGSAGRVTVSAGSLTIINQGVISSDTGGSGNAGDVTVTVGGTLTVNSSIANNFITGISSQADTGSTGNAGNVTVNAGSLALSNNAGISAATSGSGSGGDVTVNAGSLSLSNNASVSAATFGPGTGGNVTVSVAGNINLQSQGQIFAGTGGPGQAGDVSVTAVEGLTIIGTTGNILTGITAQADPGSTGNAGRVTVSAGNLTILDQGEILSVTGGSGNSGSITVTVSGALTVNSSIGDNVVTGISAQTNEGSTGNAGDVVVHANSLALGSFGTISSATLGSGVGGDVSVTASGGITLSGPGPQITAVSTSTSDAGNIAVSAYNLLLDSGAGISTEAKAANGGAISISIDHLIYSRHGFITTTVAGFNGNGGNITIDPRYVVLDDSTIEANAVGGNGGNISITAEQFIASPDSVVQASSTKGINGLIAIRAPADTVTGVLANLKDRFTGPPEVNRDCAAPTARSGLSSVTSGGHGALPEVGDEPGLAHYFIQRPGGGLAMEPAPPGPTPVALAGAASDRRTDCR
jgi:filamentous hemagglutinin family protein